MGVGVAAPWCELEPRLSEAKAKLRAWVQAGGRWAGEGVGLWWFGKGRDTGRDKGRNKGRDSAGGKGWG